MLRRIPFLSAPVLSSFVAVIALSVVCGALAQQPAAEGAGKGKAKGKGKEGSGAHAPLFFREEWKQTPSGGEHDVTTDAVSNSNLELKLYGTTAKSMQLTGDAGSDTNPIHLWTGLCNTVCSATLRDKRNYADMTGLAKIRWVTKVSGFHKVHPILKLADGTFLAGDAADGSILDWHESEFSIADVRWLKFDSERGVTVGTWVEKPDLSKVDEIGFSDLMPASGHGQGGWSDVGKIEVYAKPVPRG
ncbi:MAG TPA: hypothetical protein VN841_05160 [Bryobacteraceae bacterium]|nr:hypothetical protein [Bryobacteraceae bacterium]